jgi:hypothetical protein
MSSPVHIDPIDTYMTAYFWYHETVEAIIHHFILRGVDLCHVSDLAQLSDAMIDNAQEKLKLSNADTLMLKQLRDAQLSRLLT